MVSRPTAEVGTVPIVLHYLSADFKNRTGVSFKTAAQQPALEELKALVDMPGRRHHGLQ